MNSASNLKERSSINCPVDSNQRVCRTLKGEEQETPVHVNKSLLEKEMFPSKTCPCLLLLLSFSSLLPKDFSFSFSFSSSHNVIIEGVPPEVQCPTICLGKDRVIKQGKTNLLVLSSCLSHTLSSSLFTRLLNMLPLQQDSPLMSQNHTQRYLRFHYCAFPN